MNPIKLHKRFKEYGLEVIVSGGEEDSSLGRQVFFVQRDDDQVRKFMRVCRRMGALNQVFSTCAHVYFVKQSFWLN